MSEIVIRMDSIKRMPERCLDCQVPRDICDRMMLLWQRDGKTGANSRHPDCPIIGVLPEQHGRLVDADGLRHSWLNLKDCGEDFCVETIVNSIDRQEAIVPAAEDLHDAICIMMSKEKWRLLGGLIEDVLDTFIEVGNGVTDEMFDHALDQLFDARDLLYGREFEMRTHDYD